MAEAPIALYGDPATDDDLAVYICPSCESHLWLITAEEESRPICGSCGWTLEPQEEEENHGPGRSSH